MLRASAIALTALALSACSPAAGVESDQKSDQKSDSETTDSQASGAAGPAGISVESISDTRSAPVDDQFITCTQTRDNGITLTQHFLIQGGAVKSYSQMQNYARPMCDAGQKDCALGWQGEEIGLYFRTNSGALNQILVDVETLTMRKRLTTSTRGVEESTAQCTSGPHPEGVRID